MSVLTMTTDWGLRDSYVAAFKGLLLRRMASVQVIDVTHQLQAHDRMGASYILRNTYPNFPEGTVHFIGVNSLEGVKTGNGSDYLIVAAAGHLFVGADCGIFSMMLDNLPYKAWRLPLQEESTQEELTVFLVESIVQLLRGVAPEQIGEPHEQIIEAKLASSMGDSSGLRGSVLHIDSFGNVVFNITKQQFTAAIMDRRFTIHLRRATYRIDQLSLRYDTSPDGELIALFNQDGFLEIAINKGNAAQLIGLKLFDSILIEFHDQADRQDEIPARARAGVS